MNGRAVGLALIAAACGAGCGEPPPPPPSSEVASAQGPAASAPRRPTRRFYLARTSERCEIYSEDRADRSEPLPTPCPEYLLIGERLRVAGKTCILENHAQPDREKPVVCPDPLTHFEKVVRAEGH